MTPYPITPVQRFCGITARDPANRQWAIDRLSNLWGPVTVRSHGLPFDAGGYYRDQMGDDLQQELVAFGEPVAPDGLADWKHETNDLESVAAQQKIDTVGRPINLDCGYITEAKFVLATTKNRSHRIYLRDGIFAEITLTYIGGRWRENKQTYPNYRTDDVANFADQCRQCLRRHLKKAS